MTSQTTIKPLEYGGYFVSRVINQELVGFKVKKDNQLLNVIKKNDEDFLYLYKLNKETVNLGKD